ncbi:MAG: T9SS type A sorting domain-containing protein [Bacteroidota bacterium]
MKKPSILVQLLCFLFLFLGPALSAQGSLLQVVAATDSLQCHGDNDGELFWQISGGTAPYSYEWQRLSNSFVFASGEQTLNGLAGPVGGNLEANVYIIAITDAAGNEARDTVEIGEPGRILVTDVAVDNSRCFHSCDGRIAMTITGGTGTLLTQWTDEGGPGPVREGLCAGEYVFFILDERGCRQKGSLGITAPAAIETEVVEEKPSCAGATNGALSASAVGGTGELSYAWSTGQTATQIAALPDGAYELTVTDESACELITLIELDDGPTMQANLQVNYGCGDGQIIVSTQPINGSAPYTYDWSTGSAAPWLFQMSTGTYELELTDANGCTDNVTFDLDYVPPLAVEETVQNVSCPGSADGAVSLAIEGGLPPYSVRWEDNFTDLERVALSGGVYDYNISASGCALAGVVVVEEPAAWEAEFIFSPQANDLLTATALVSGGSFPYQFQWSNGNTGLSASDLSSDQSYSLIVTDASGCQREWEVQPTLTSLGAIQDEMALQVYPNPSKGVFFVQDQSSIPASSFVIYSPSGQTIHQLQAIPLAPFEIDLSNYPAGTYYLHSKGGASSKVVELMKQ